MTKFKTLAQVKSSMSQFLKLFKIETTQAT